MALLEQPSEDLTARQWRRWEIAAISVFCLGLLWRWCYIFCIHPPQQYIYSDMGTYTGMARNWANPNYVPGVYDAAFSPAMGFFLGFFYRLDPSWCLAQGAYFVLSTLTPLMAGLIGKDLFGLRAGALSLMLASVYFPFIDFSGYFLSETPFLFFMLVSFWLLLRSTRALRGATGAGLGLLSGLTLGIAAAFRSVILGPGFLLVCYLGYLAWRRREKRILLVFAGGLAGLLLLLVPLAIRNTRLNEGRFCVVTSNAASNFFSGHCGIKICWLEFHDNKRGYVWGFASPCACQRRFEKRIVLNCGLCDSAKLSAMAWKWIRAHPLDALAVSCDHVFALFTDNIPWPPSDTSTRGWTILSEELYYVFVLFPLWLYLWPRRKVLLRLKPEMAAETLLLLPMLGLMIAVFCTNGEARYRIPFDGFMLILAAHAFLSGRQSAPASAQSSTGVFAASRPPEVFAPNSLR